METLTVKIPNGKSRDVSAYVKEIGGEVIQTKKIKADTEQDEDNEVTHGVFFGENIKRVIKAFKKN